MFDQIGHRTTRCLGDICGSADHRNAARLQKAGDGVHGGSTLLGVVFKEGQHRGAMFTARVANALRLAALGEHLVCR